MKSSWQDNTLDTFEGAPCVDSGAQKTIIGIPQAQTYCSLFNMELGKVVKGTKLAFKFGDSTHKEIGNIPVSIPVYNRFFLSFTADVVDVDVPLLLGLDLLTQARLILDFDEDAVHSKADG